MPKRWNPTTPSSGAATERSKLSSSTRTRPSPGSGEPREDPGTTSRSRGSPSSSDLPGETVQVPHQAVDSPIERERAHIYRIGSLKVPVRKVEVRQGPKGQFARRLKEILRKTRSIPKKPFSDPDAYEPPRRPSPPSRGLPGMRRESFRLEHDEPESDDED